MQENNHKKRGRVTWERRRGFQERLKSKLAFVSSLRLALTQRCTAKLTGLGAHGQLNTHTVKMADAFTCVSVKTDTNIH